ncbi:MAG: CotH kinase family protein, partial [Nannocystaceae bacterium]
LDDKPSFKLKFNEYVPGRRFLGLEGLTLNSMVVDGSMLREWIGFRLFRELGVPAPMAGYAEVYLDGEPYGLYLNLEPYDDEFLERVFDDPSGNLYESDRSSDVDGDVDRWDQDEGEDDSRDDLRVLAELATREGHDVFYGDEAVIDMPHLLGFMAGETIMGHFDGHIGGHNFFIYHEPSADRWSYLPWSLDQTVSRRVTPWEHEGFLGDKCLHDERCLVDYVLASEQALDRLGAIDLEAEVDRVIELTEAAVEADERKPYSAETVAASRESALAWALRRPEDLRPSLDCLVDGVQPDADGDGYGPCFQDCDESDPEIHEGATELCNGIDDDCSGFVDDTPDCECPSVQAGGRTFYLCHNRIAWLEARDYCAEQGRVLARFDDAEQTAQVWAAAAEIASGRWAIGLNDRAVENDYRWLDGSAPGFELWASGEPSHQLEWFDCVFLIGGAWSEGNCIEKSSFICTDD